jgi:hypothetical protein
MGNWSDHRQLVFLFSRTVLRLYVADARGANVPGPRAIVCLKIYYGLRRR